MKSDHYADWQREFNHERKVRSFLKANGIDYNHHEELFNLPNADVYVNVCKVSRDPLVSDKDLSLFKKFKVYWLKSQGEVSQKKLDKMNKMINYYMQKRHNANARLARKSTGRAV